MTLDLETRSMAGRPGMAADVGGGGPGKHALVQRRAAPAATVTTPAVQLTQARPGGNDPLGRKENLLLQWQDEMVEVANELAARFTPLGLQFRPQILLATAMQEAAARDPLNARSFDNGLGIMQITPYRGRLDPEVARAIGWDNSASVATNIRNSRWRDARANLLAGGYTMLGKATAIRRALPRVWEQMDEPQRWRAVLYAYNAGESSAISALRRGGPNARMISTFTNPRGVRVSHDYTQEIQEKLDYVEAHDPFDDEAPRRAPPASSEDGGDEPERPERQGQATARRLRASVGRGGRNREADVSMVQERLHQRSVRTGSIDGDVGPRTIGAIERFQAAVLGFSDGLIEPGKNTERELFSSEGAVQTAEPQATRDPQPDGGGGARRDGGREVSEEPEERDGAREEREHPTFAAISRDFNASIAGTPFTWHEAFWLPTFGRHVRASDVTNIAMDTLIANVERQARALAEVREVLGRPIVVHCWVRPPAYNRRIGGAASSSHLRGTATDFHMPGLTAERVRQAVRRQNLYPGAGELNVSWVHLDLEHRTWFNP